MRNTESALNRLQRSLESRLSSGQKLSENRQKFHDKFDVVQSLLVSLEERIQSLFDTTTLNLTRLREQHNQSEELKTALRRNREALDEVEELGAEFIQSSGIANNKRRSMSLETATGSGETIGRITRQWFELRKRQVKHFVNKKRTFFRLVFKKGLEEEEYK